MSSELGSADSLSRSAGGLSAGLQQRNRFWIQHLDERIAELEGKMRASGDLERSRTAPEDGHAVAAGDWSWPGMNDWAATSATSRDAEAD